jgi:hypothetical protein
MISDPSNGLELLHHACSHVRSSWDIRMDRVQAQANLDARAILFTCANKILREYGLGITREEVEGAAIIEKGSGCRVI